MSLVNVIILIIINLVLYGFIAARLLGWRPPGWSAENPVSRILSAALAVSITSAVVLLGMYLLTSGLVDASDSTSVLQIALWIDCAIIILLLVLRVFPRLPLVSLLRWDTARHQFLAIAIAIAATAAVTLVCIVLVNRGVIGRFSGFRMLRIILWVDGVVGIILAGLWIFPRLPWPVYGKSTVRSSGEWRQALYGLAIAALILFTVIGGFFIAYGESGFLDYDLVSKTPKSMYPTENIVLVENTEELDVPSNITLQPNVSATFTGLPTRTGTEIPTVTPTTIAGNVKVTQRATKLVTRAPTSTPSVATETRVSVTVTATTTTTATATATATATECVTDVGEWVEYRVKYGDTLSNLAGHTGVRVVDIVEANCLSDLNLKSGQFVYLPINIDEDYDGLIVRMSTLTPIIDGNLDDWNVLPFVADQVVYGSNVWNNSSDLSATYGLAWDDLYLYVAIEVRDDIHVQTEIGETIFKGDSVEILFDKDIQNDAGVRKLNSDDYQIGLSPGSFSNISVMPQVHRWYPIGKSRTITIAKIESIHTGMGYKLEAALPWSILGTTVAVGDEYGFVLSVSDNDTLGVSVQESMVSSLAARELTDPSTWGKIKLIR